MPGLRFTFLCNNFNICSGERFPRLYDIVLPLACWVTRLCHHRRKVYVPRQREKDMRLMKIPE